MILILIGPTCVGKTTIAKELIKKTDGLTLTKSCTTRDMRHGEIDGDEYYFISKTEFEDKMKNGELIEWNLFNGNYYGTPINEFEKNNVISVLDINGANQIKSMFPAAKTIFIMPPNLYILKERLKERKLSNDEIKNRIEIAEKEIERCYEFDYLITNDDLNKTIYSIIHDIIGTN